MDARRPLHGPAASAFGNKHLYLCGPCGLRPHAKITLFPELELRGEVDHLDGGGHGIEALVTSLGAGALDGLLD